MARTKTVLDDVEQVLESEGMLPYHPMVRFLSAAGIDEPHANRWSVETVKLHLKEWVDRGYVVKHTQYISSAMDESGTNLAGIGLYFLLEYVG